MKESAHATLVGANNSFQTNHDSGAGVGGADVWLVLDDLDNTVVVHDLEECFDDETPKKYF